MHVDIKFIQDAVEHLFKTNPFITGGASVALMAWAMNQIKNVPGKISGSFQRFIDWRFRTRVKIYVDGPLYSYFYNFLESIKPRYRWVKGTIGVRNNGLCVHLLPDSGTSKWFVWEGNLVRATVVVPRSNASASNESLSAMIKLMEGEHVALEFYSFQEDAPKRFLRHLIDNFKDPERTRGSIIVQQLSESGNWSDQRHILKRSESSIICADGVLESLINDARIFFGDSDRYDNLGIPYHRGYLLYGPPGNGKTSIVHTLASTLNLDICALDISSDKLNDQALARGVSGTTGAILLLEDVDCMFVERDLSERQSGVSFSGLLNALDGLLAPRKVLIIMTTNHIDRLDEALIRDGRIDRKIHIRNANKDQAARMFLRFFPGEQQLSERFAALVPDEQFSTAALQGHLLKFRDEPDAAILNIEQLIGDKNGSDRDSGESRVPGEVQAFASQLCELAPSGNNGGVGRS